MDLDLSEEQAELQRTVRTVLEEQCPMSLVREVVENGSSVDQPWQSATEHAWTAVTVPEAFGGLGLGFEELGSFRYHDGRARPHFRGPRRLPGGASKRGVALRLPMRGLASLVHMSFHPRV